MNFEAKKFGESDILDWIKQSIQNENLYNSEINITGTSDGQNDGFTSDIFFATVTGVDERGANKEINLVLKVSKEYGQDATTDVLLKLISEREVLVYTQLFPTLRKFQQDKNVTAPFKAVPKCYKTFSFHDTGVIVLVFENLRSLGYKLHNKTISMDTRHIRLVLEQYSKFHAASFAMRDQKPGVYKALAEQFHCHSKMLSEGFRNTMAKISQHLKEASREDLAEKFEKAVENGVENIMNGILTDEVEQSVVIHGDCHSNNLMFKYEGKKPTRAMILDWQVAFQHSPVLDLSYFLYQAAGKNLDKIHEFLRFYHSELTKNLEEMGTDAKNVFPYSSLVEQWKKYSIYGLIFTIQYLDLFFIEEGIKVKLGDINIKYLEAYREKLIPAVDHYCNYKF